MTKHSWYSHYKFRISNHFTERAKFLLIADQTISADWDLRFRISIIAKLSATMTEQSKPILRIIAALLKRNVNNSTSEKKQEQKNRITISQNDSFSFIVLKLHLLYALCLQTISLSSVLIWRGNFQLSREMRETNLMVSCLLEFLVYQLLSNIAAEIVINIDGWSADCMFRYTWYLHTPDTDIHN